MASSRLRTHPELYPGPPLRRENDIRLLILLPGVLNAPVCCQLIATSLGAAPEYEALSYVWGDSSMREPIGLRNLDSESIQTYSVTSNCLAALRRLRYEDRPRTMWIDALCIDQSDVAERSYQITLMSEIYSKAAQVVVYLGEEADDSDLAIDFIVECDTPTQGNVLAYAKSSMLIQALSTLLRRPWFHRVWVFQEIAFARHATVLCGTRSVKWSAMINFDGWNVCSKWLPQLPYVIRARKPLPNYASTLRPAAEEVFRQLSGNRQATDTHDFIYALLPFLPLSDLGISLVPNYALSSARVFTDLAAQLVGKTGFRVLQYVQGRSSRVAGLPSWVPDWTLPPVRSTLTPMWFPQDDTSSETTHALRVLEPREDNGTFPGHTWPANTLRAFGRCKGQIVKVGSIYTAGQVPFPLDEWMDLAEVDIELDLEETRTMRFSSLISGGHPYDMRFIQGFVNAEKERTQKDPDTSWEKSVRELPAWKGATYGCQADFNEIPFHEAGYCWVASGKRAVARILRRCHARRLFATDTGYLGLGPSELRLGDRVYLCIGAHIDFAFRDVEEGTTDHIGRRVNLVGECYVEHRAPEDTQEASGALECLYIV